MLMFETILNNVPDLAAKSVGAQVPRVGRWGVQNLGSKPDHVKPITCKIDTCRLALGITKTTHIY